MLKIYMTQSYVCTFITHILTYTLIIQVHVELRLIYILYGQLIVRSSWIVLKNEETKP